MFSVNLESITFMKVKIILYQGKPSLQRGMFKFCSKTNNPKSIQLYKSYVGKAYEVDVKIEYLIVP